MKALASATLVGLGLCLTPVTYGDTLFGLYIGGGSIDYDMSGEIKDLEQEDANSLDLEDDLGLEGEAGSYLYIALEHGIPIVPNVKVAFSDITETATNLTDNEIDFGGETFPADSRIRTDLDFSHYDFTFYYELLDNWVNLDLGLTVRQLDGEMEIQGYQISSPSFVISAKEDLDFAVPLLYGKAQFDLPLTGLYAGVEGNWIGAGGTQLYDLWGKVGYTFAFGLGLEAGMRKMAIELDDVEDLDADVTLEGTYLAATFHF
ncbi:TIGR04219 family outer membrane beta-barrel protein [Ketobacter sp.]|uniref:TIGR04219 family outer membrane beta-barrel protein n=1 Tax=Ketobacter sp. TaxID=2083498 RepID=UPI000F25B7E9|nr:TIGR04219 family outer membrane beta-barrel protein [Ketobacter sp.]RLU01485.1 MAG: TIGR04219 family outer membrane beta-barrel protein [Ketobacter sp.]